MMLNKFPADFKKAREAENMTQEKVAELLNVCREEIGQIEVHGRIPKVPIFLRGCRLFGLDPMDYAGEEAGADEPIRPH